MKSLFAWNAITQIKKGCSKKYHLRLLIVPGDAMSIVRVHGYDGARSWLSCSSVASHWSLWSNPPDWVSHACHDTIPAFLALCQLSYYHHVSISSSYSFHYRSGFGWFTKVKAQTCDTALWTMSHMDIHINCPVSATSLSDCYFVSSIIGQALVDSQKSRHRLVTQLQGLWVTWTSISTVHQQQHLSLIAVLFLLF